VTTLAGAEHDMYVNVVMVRVRAHQPDAQRHDGDVDAEDFSSLARIARRLCG
jgi:hypothetical protein